MKNITKMNENNVPELSIQNLFKKYKNTIVLDDLSANFEKNTISAIFGKNGSGKSTLFKILLSLSTKDSGKLVLKEGITIAGSVNEPSFFKSYSGKENLDVLLEKYDDEKYKYFIEKFSMEDYIEKPVKTYSIGMKQRLTNLLVLLTDADILLFDEPNSGLDSQGVDTFFDIIKEISKKKTIIFSSHLTYRIIDVCDEIYTLNNGKLENGFVDLKEENQIKFEFTFESIKKAKKVYTYLEEFLKTDQFLINNKTIEIYSTKEEIETIIRKIKNTFDIDLKPVDFIYGEVIDENQK